MKTRITTLATVAVLGYLASTCFVAVDETEYVIIKQFGRPTRTVLDPGLQVKWPVPIQTVVRFDNRLQVFEDPAAGGPDKEYLTRDKKNVEVATATFWKINRSDESVLKFLETVADPEGAQIRLGDIVKSQLNAKLGSINFETLVSIDNERRRWAETVEDIHSVCSLHALRSFGIDIVDLRIQRLNFPTQNRRSVFDRMRAERKQIATQYRSEGDAEAMRIRAEAQAEQQRILAEATERSERIRGEADAEATRIYGRAYSTDPDLYRFLRTLESYEKGIDERTVLILPSDSEFFRLLSYPDMDTGVERQDLRENDVTVSTNSLPTAD